MTQTMPVQEKDDGANLLTARACAVRLVAPALILTGLAIVSLVGRTPLFFAIAIPICLGDACAWIVLWWRVRHGTRLADPGILTRGEGDSEVEVFVRGVDAAVMTLWAAALQGWLAFMLWSEEFRGAVPLFLLFCALMADLGAAWQWHRYRKARHALTIQESVRAAEVGVALAGAMSAHVGMAQALATAVPAVTPVAATIPGQAAEGEKLRVGRAV